MNRKPVTRALSQTFIWSFAVTVGSFVALIVLGATMAPHSGIAPVEGVLLLFMVVAGWAWYISLGIVAHRLGRRWLVWTGISFITAPIGPLIAFPLMLSHIKAARHTQPEGTAPAV